MRLSLDVLREIGVASSLRLAEDEAFRARSRRSQGLRMAAVAGVPLFVLLWPPSPQNLAKLAQEEPWAGRDTLAYAQSLADQLGQTIRSKWAALDATWPASTALGIARLADLQPLQAQWQAIGKPIVADVQRIGAIMAGLPERMLTAPSSDPGIDLMPVGSINRPDEVAPPHEASEAVAPPPQPTEASDDTTLLRQALSAGTLSPRGRLRLGDILLERDDEEGLVVLLALADHDPRMVAAAKPKVDTFALRHQFSRNAQRSQARLAELAKVAALALEERRTIRQYDTFSAPLLDASTVSAMHACFSRNEGIAAARVAAKRVARWTELPAYVVVLDLPVETERASAIRAEVVACLEALDIDGTVQVVGSSDPPARRHLADLASIEGAVVYRRGG
jgi:hypothetical protein